jgi:N-acyl-D-aspartate/D-glutamate deacylase
MDDAPVRKHPTAAEMAEMKRLVADAIDQGAIGLGTLYSLNHSGWRAVAMPSTISDLSEFDALASWGQWEPLDAARRDFPRADRA